MVDQVSCKNNSKKGYIKFSSQKSYLLNLKKYDLEKTFSFRKHSEKENKIFLIYKEIQMRNKRRGFLIYEENLIFFFISV